MFSVFFFFLLKNLFLPQQLWSSCWPAVKWRREKEKGDLFLRTQLSINDFLLFAPSVVGFHFQMPGCRIHVPEEGTMSSFTHPVHRAWPLLQILSPVTAGMSCASLLFLRLIIHVTDFRCIRSQVLEIWDNLKITDAKPRCLSQHLQLVYEIKQNRCSGWLIFTRAPPFPIRNQNACYLCVL